MFSSVLQPLHAIYASCSTSWASQCSLVITGSGLMFDMPLIVYKQGTRQGLVMRQRKAYRG